MGATRDRYEAIDLSDNNLRNLGGFGVLPSLHRLLVCNNRISSLSPGLGRSLPALSSLVLTNNSLAQISDLAPLAELAPSLRRLSLVGNPVSRLPDTRLYLAHILPKLAVLDFAKVTKDERIAARQKFASTTHLGSDLDDANTFDPNAPLPGMEASSSSSSSASSSSSSSASAASGMTTDERAAIAKLLDSVSTIEEVNRIKILSKTPKGRASLLDGSFRTSSQTESEGTNDEGEDEAEDMEGLD